MKQGIKRLACAFLCVLVFAASGIAAFADGIQVPEPTTNFANDFAGVLSQSTKDQINAESKKLEKEKGIQFVVVTVENLNNESVEDYANALFSKWGIGSKETDKGLLLLLSTGDRKDKIEVGNGLQGDLTDVEAKDLLDTGKSYLKKNDFDAGIREIYVKTLGKLLSLIHI